jgi:hypothetical protein
MWPTGDSAAMSISGMARYSATDGARACRFYGDRMEIAGGGGHPQSLCSRHAVRASLDRVSPAGSVSSMRQID